MLVFESLSVGIMVVLCVMLAVLLVVGVYVMIVWPLTFWDLTDSGLERYGSWVKTVLWSLFAGGLLRIVDGEMRYWAARLCGWTELDAKVRAQKPTYLRSEQYAANVLL